MDREPNAREQFEKYRDDDIKGLTNYAREYGAVKALELAAQKTATLQLVIDRYRTGELRAELRPEPTAGDREAAAILAKYYCQGKGMTPKEIDDLMCGITAALSAARGDRAELEAAAREMIAAVWLITQKFDSRVASQLSKCQVATITKAAERLVAILGEVKA